MAAAAARHGISFEATLDQGGLDARALHAYADTIGTRHAAAPPVTGTAFRQKLIEAAGTPAQRAELALHIADIDRRARAGRVRKFHDGSPVDVLYDLAGPLAQMLHDKLPAEANILANRYLDVTPQGATGWALLPLLISLRAALEGDAALAEKSLSAARPRLVVIGGLSGTGKSTLARLLGARIGRTPGGRVLRSDVFRKRLAGLPPETRLPPAHYTRRSDAETYEAMFESADDHLACGSSVILDAVFMSRSERDVAEALAIRARVPFTGIWLEAPEQDRIDRVRARSGDASDAGVEVVRDQSRRSVGDISGWHRMRVNRPIELIVPAARAVLERVGR
jgi:predicted kinase